MSETPEGSKIFYGWFVVAACCAGLAILAQAFSSFGIFFKSLEGEFNWSRTLVSSGFTVFAIGYGISAGISGWLVDRYNPRYTLLTSALLGGLGFGLCAWMNNIWQFRLFALIAGMGTGATFSVPTSIVQRWFRGRHNAGTALAIVISGYGIGQLIFTPLINSFIVSYGWRNAYLITGLLFFTIIFTSMLIVRPSPVEVHGLGGKKLEELASTQGYSTAKAMTSPVFIAILYGACINSAAVQIITVHLVPRATDLGISSTVAAAALGLMGGLSLPGRLTTGHMSRRIEWRRLWYWALFGMAASLVWLLFLKTTWMLYVFVFLFGTFTGVGAVAQWGIVADFFGLRSLGELSGITSGISTLLGSATPFLTGYVFDATGSYLIAFSALTALVFSGGIVVALAKRPPRSSG